MLRRWRDKRKGNDQVVFRAIVVFARDIAVNVLVTVCPGLVTMADYYDLCCLVSTQQPESPTKEGPSQSVTETSVSMHASSNHFH